MFEVLVASKPRPVRTLPQTVGLALTHLTIVVVVLNIMIFVGMPAISLGGAISRPPFPGGQPARVTGPWQHSPDFRALGQRYTRWYLNGHVDSLVAVMDAALRKRLGGYAGIKRDLDAELLRIGPEESMVAERYTIDTGIVTFTHEGRFRRTGAETVEIRWSFGPDGQIIRMPEPGR